MAEWLQVLLVLFGVVLVVRWATLPTPPTPPTPPRGGAPLGVERCACGMWPVAGESSEVCWKGWAHTRAACERERRAGWTA